MQISKEANAVEETTKHSFAMWHARLWVSTREL